MGSRFDSLQPQEKEAVALWVILRRLGFGVDQIGAGKAPSGQAMVNVLRDDGPVYTVMLGPFIDTTAEQFVGRWKLAVRGIHEGAYTDAEINGLLAPSQAFLGLEELVDSLMTRGFLYADGQAVRVSERKPGPGDLILNLEDFKP